MNPVRMIILAVAVLAGMACVAVLVRGMASNQPHATAPSHPTVQVLVAKRDLAVGDRIDTPDVSWQAWPADATNPAYIVDGPPTVAPGQNLTGAATRVADAAKVAVSGPSPALTSVVGTLVRMPILAGEPVLRSKLVRAGAAGVMAVTLDPGMRAMALPLTAESAVGGFILPGDHVDIVLSQQLDRDDGLGSAGPAGKDKHFAARVVLNNVRVLAIDQSNVGPDKGIAQIGATATVEVSPDQAQQLVVAKNDGQLTFVLRSYADAAGPATSGGASGNSGVVRVFTPGGSSSVMVTQ